jgi:hypothetical protein
MQAASSENGEPMESTQRVEALLSAMLLHQLRDLQQAQKAEILSRAGLPNIEIAKLVGTSSGVVAQQLYELRSKGAKARGKKGKKK